MMVRRTYTLSCHNKYFFRFANIAIGGGGKGEEEEEEEEEGGEGLLTLHFPFAGTAAMMITAITAAAPLLLLLPLLPLLRAATPAAGKRPHIVFFLADGTRSPSQDMFQSLWW